MTSQDTTADDIQVALVAQSRSLLENVVADYAALGYGTETALRDVALQGIYRTMLLANLLPEEVRAQIAHMPIISVPSQGPTTVEVETAPAEAVADDEDDADL